MIRTASRAILASATGLLALTSLTGHAEAAPRAAAPTLTVTGPAGDATASRGDTVHLASAGLDPSRPASLYKGRWSTTTGFTGWEYLYYKGYAVAADGTLAINESQDQAGSFRYQACQYYEATPKNRRVCTNYAALTVRA